MDARGLGIVLVLLLAVVCPAGAAADSGEEPSPAERDSLAEAWVEEVEEQGSWLDRLLHRYFGHAPQTGEELQGRAVNIVDHYAEYADKKIAVVIVQSVLRFEEAPDPDTEAADWLGSLASRFRSYTRDSVIRQYVLFESGDQVDPYALADTERMIRSLAFINDARILLLPLGDSDDEVVVVIEYRDRWPIGIRGTVIDQNRFRAGIYSTNLFGQGILFDNTVIVNRAGEPQVGYRGILSRQNLGGTFIDATGSFEDSWVTRTWAARLDRFVRHASIAWVGGLRWESHDSRDNGGVPRKLEDTDHWIGHVFQASKAQDLDSPARRSLTPAFNFRRRTFLDRPEVRADTLTEYHNRYHHLVGLTFQKRTDVKTSYLFRMGEVEDLPHGMSIQLSGGYEEAEFAGRATGLLSMSGISVRNRGDVIALVFNMGGYWRSRDFEDGALDVAGVYITKLIPSGRYRWRFYFRGEYTQGFDRVNPDGLDMGDRAGIRDLPNGLIRGDKRALFKFETRVFTPWRLLGFDIMSLFYADAGSIGAERDDIITKKIYYSLGAGFRFYNPDLVLPTFELRFGIVENIDNRGFAVAFDLGNANYPNVVFPGVKPGLAPYE